jgi:hypothetical protein
MGQRSSLLRQVVFGVITSLLLLDSYRVLGFAYSFLHRLAAKRIKLSVMALPLGGRAPPLHSNPLDYHFA